MLWLVLLNPTSATAGGEIQDVTALGEMARAYLNALPNMPDNQSLDVQLINPHLKLPACASIEFSTVSTSSKSRNHFSLIARCLSPKKWATYLNVKLHEPNVIYLARRTLPAGTAISPNDFYPQSEKMHHPGTITSLDALHGHRLKHDLSAGSSLRHQDLEASPHAINPIANQQHEQGKPVTMQPGQIVKVIISGNGFQITSEGRLLTRGVVGQSVQVRAHGKQSVTGVLRELGVVEVIN